MALNLVGKNKAAGLDCLSDKHMKPLLSKEKIISKITKSFNHWFLSHKIPSYLKTARIVVLSKEKSNFPTYGNIRPIAILPTLFKVFEIIILQRLR